MKITSSTEHDVNDAGTTLISGEELDTAGTPRARRAAAAEPEHLLLQFRHTSPCHVKLRSAMLRNSIEKSSMRLTKLFTLLCRSL